MLARAIGYWDTPFRSWQFLLEGSSSGGFLCALEDLWKKLLEMVPLSAQGEFGRVERRVVLTGGVDMEVGTWTGEEYVVA